MADQQTNISAFQIQCGKKECLNFIDCSVSVNETRTAILRPFHPKLVFESDKADMSRMRINCKTYRPGIVR